MSGKEKKQRREEPVSEEELQQMAVQAGLKNLASQPGLRNYAVLIMNNIDNEKIYSFTEGIKKELKEKNVPYKQQNKLIYKNIANYVASGNALKDKTIQTLFDKGHGEKLNQGVLEKLVEFFKPNKFEGGKYFEKARSAYGDMYDILSQDEVAQSEIPELAKAAKAMKMYGFLDIALKNFKAHGMIDDKMYKTLSQELYKKTAIKSEEGRKGLENYILSKDVKEEKEEENKAVVNMAASIIGFFGIMLMVFNLTITGNVIGGDSSITSGIVGVFMIFFALLLFVRPLKRSFKK